MHKYEIILIGQIGIKIELMGKTNLCSVYKSFTTNPPLLDSLMQSCRMHFLIKSKLIEHGRLSKQKQRRVDDVLLNRPTGP